MAKSKFTAQKGSRGRTPGALTTADLIVLSLLVERAMHGYELLGEYDRQEVADWASVSKAQVYYAIQKLAKLALIEPSALEAEDSNRDRTVYIPTKRGYEELAASLAKLEWAQARVPQPFSTWLGLSIHADHANVTRVLEARKTFLEEELQREKASLAYIKTLAATRAKVGVSIVQLVISQLEVELEWVRNMLKSNIAHVQK